MRRIKTIISVVLSIVICFSYMPLCAFARSNTKEQTHDVKLFKENEKSLITEETSMPQLPFQNNPLGSVSFMETADISAFIANDIQYNTLLLPERTNWARKTSHYLSDTYDQPVSSIKETKDYIVFEFDNPESLNPYEEHVLKVEYIKPESSLGTNYETKIVYMWGWKSGYYELDSRKGVWSAIKNLTIAVAGLNKKIALTAFATSILDIAAGVLQDPKKIDARSTVKYYFLNKYVQVKSPQFGYWLPMAEAGIRKGCRRCIMEEIDRYGQSRTIGVKETIGTPSSNPTNCEETKTSPHFNNNTWLVNKAIEMFINDDTYSESYGVPDVVYQGTIMP